MPHKYPEFQPGAILHEVILGAFRASGTTFETWCNQNGIEPASARNSTFGQGRGEKGLALKDRIIDAAGREFVRTFYIRRLTEHYEQVTGVRPQVEAVE